MLGSTCEDITVFRRCMLPMKCSSATFRFHYFPLDFAKRRLSYWFNIASGYPVAIQVLFIQSSLPLHANHTKVLCGDLSYIWSLDLVKEKLKCSNSILDWRLLKEYHFRRLNRATCSKFTTSLSKRQYILRIISFSIFKPAATTVHIYLQGDYVRLSKK